MPCGGSLEVGRCVPKPAMSHSLWDALNTVTHLVIYSLPLSMNIGYLKMESVLQTRNTGWKICKFRRKKKYAEESQKLSN